ncbi:MAG TPA: tetratricopeptide repeat protein [Planctomycetaceae bacterium]|jgi:tetratricopeptide (TPR) repeat protein
MTNSLSFEDLCLTGRGHLKAGRLDDALAAFAEAARINEFDADVHDGLATVHFLQNNYEAAIRHFERVTRLDPRRGAAWVNLGAVYNRMASYQKAAEVLRRAVQIEKKSSAGYYNLGIAYKHLKQWALAVPAYREAIRLDPKMADAYLNLGNVYVAMKNFAQAASHFKKALDLKPGLERARLGLEKAEAELEAAKNKSSPFGRLVDAEQVGAAASGAPTPTRELTEEERGRDRRELSELLVRLEAEFHALVGSTGDQLGPAVRTLNKMLTQALSPHGVSITKAEALEQFIEARSQYTPALVRFRETLRQLREHEARYQ